MVATMAVGLALSIRCGLSSPNNSRGINQHATAVSSHQTASPTSSCISNVNIAKPHLEINIMTADNTHKYAPAKFARVWNIRDYAKRFRLDRFEEKRLLKLLGPTATERQLLMNAGRRPL
ncbi:hypothetical protein [Rhizobium sp. RHZ01]|uniref:hypothetical protein n=1 Tax=Rhizobium sp. RHZ01 TaxID=2769304 RepID=UPI0032B2F1B6